MEFTAPVLLIAGVIASACVLRLLRRKGWIDTSPGRMRRGTGHAMMGLQEFIQPSVEYVIQAENSGQTQDDDCEGDDPQRLSIPPAFRRK